MSEPEWTFEVLVTTPSGVRTVVTVTVPEHRAWSDVGEVAELAQMCASSASSRLTKMLHSSAERCRLMTANENGRCDP